MPTCSYSACSGTVHVNTNLGIERYVHHCALPEDAPLVGEAVCIMERDVNLNPSSPADLPPDMSCFYLSSLSAKCTCWKISFSSDNLWMENRG